MTIGTISLPRPSSDAGCSWDPHPGSAIAFWSGLSWQSIKDVVSDASRVRTHQTAMSMSPRPCFTRERSAQNQLSHSTNEQALFYDQS